MKKICLIVAVLVCLLNYTYAQYGTISVISGGTSSASFGGDGGPATSSAVGFSNPSGVATDTAGNIYIQDRYNYRIRKIHRATGIITTIAGIGTSGFSGDGGPAVVAQITLSGAAGMCVNRQGDVYIVDNYRIRAVSAATGVIRTVAGSGSYSYSGDGGPATAAGLGNPQGVYVDTFGDIYISTNARVRKVDASTGIITTFAGNGSYGFAGDGGAAISARLSYCSGITGDRVGNIYIVDEGNHRIRKVNTSGIITTVAGNGTSGYASGDGGPATDATFYNLDCIATDTSGNIYLPDAYNMIRKIDVSSGLINSVAGCYFGCSYFYRGSSSSTSVPAHTVKVAATGICINNAGDIYCSDFYDQITKISNALSGINTLAATDSLATTPCTLPARIHTGISGTITVTPSSTDSLHISVDYGQYHSNTIREYTIPYWFVSTYGFGSVFNSLGDFTYRLPGKYKPKMSITAVGGYTNEVYAPDITVGNICGSGITNVIIDSVADTLLSAVCSMPWQVKYEVWGRVAGTPSSGDSAYVIFTNASSDTTYHLHVVPYTLVGSTYYFHDTIIQSFASGSISPRVRVVSSSGLYSAERSMYGFTVRSCAHGSVSTSISDTAGFTTYCSLPFSNRFTVSGGLYDSAAFASTVNLTINYGDGTIITTSAPVISTFPGYYRYSLSGLTHTYYTTGLYAPVVVATAGTYRDSSSSSSFIIGSSCSPLTGVFYIDSSADCIRQPSEVKLGYWPYAIINNTVGDTSYGWCNDTGYFSLNLINGHTYTMIADPTGHFGYGSAGATLSPSCPASGVYTITASSSTYSQDFGFTCTPPPTMDMRVSGWGWGFVPGDTGVIGVWSSNPWGYMCDTLSSTVTLVLDTFHTYVGMWSGPAPTSISGDTLRWNFTSTASLFDFNGYVKVYTDTTATIFDTIDSRLYVAPSRITDPNLANNTLSWREPVTASWDPNEKEVSPHGFGPQGYIPNATPLSYLIHFQNTGSYVARNITLSDSISANLDIATLQVISSSSPVLVYQLPGNLIKFRFNDINLPDSVSDPMGSIGYIAFTIEPHDSLPPNTQITNRVGIYFDYNPPVYTNTTLNTIEDTIGHIYGADSVCPGATITLTNHISGGEWRCTNTRATVSGGVVTGVTPGLDTVIYTVYGHLEASKVIFVKSTPGMGTLSGSHAVCVGGSTTLSASVSGGSWTTTTSGILGVSATGVVSGLTIGTDSVFYTSTNACGTGRDAYAITVETTPVAGSISGASSLCVGATDTLTSSVAGGMWSSSTSLATVSSGGVVFGVSGGVTVISYTVSNSCGSIAATSTITINTLPAGGSVTGTTTLCAGSVTTLTASVTGGTWSSATSTIAAISGSGVVTAIGPGVDTIYYSLTNMCGITRVPTAITVITVPNPGTLTGAASVCVGASTTLTPSVTGGSWSVSGTVATVTAGVVAGITVGIDTVIYTVSNMCGSADTFMAITVNPLPDAGYISGAHNVCEGSAITLAPSVIGGVWSSSNIAIASVSAAGVVNGMTSGTATISYAVTNTCGTADAVYTITVDPLPDAGTITGSATVCKGDTVMLSNTATGGTWSSSNIFIATVSAGGIVKAIAAGPITISYTATTVCGTASTSFSLLILSATDCPTEVKQVSTYVADVSIFPNPNTGKFTLSLPAHENDVNIQIIDVHGRVVKTILVTNNSQTEISIDLTHVASGVYMIKAEADGTTYYRKVVVTD